MECRLESQTVRILQATATVSISCYVDKIDDPELLRDTLQRREV